MGKHRKDGPCNECGNVTSDYCEMCEQNECTECAETIAQRMIATFGFANELCGMVSKYAESITGEAC